MLEDQLLTCGEPAPDFLLRDLDGHPHALSHYRGRIVILNFWSAECPWSRSADETLAELTSGWGESVEWISIAPNANEPPDLLRREAAARGLPLLLHDPDRAVTGLYGAEMTPHLYVIDPGGVLRYQGAFDDRTFRKPDPTRNYLREAVQAVLAGEPPEIAQSPPYGCTIVHYA